jgi:hypothetical protein
MRTRLLSALLGLTIGVAAHAQPLSNAFTYQGRLDSGGSPATGVYDFRFALFDSAAAGAQLGPTLCVDNLSVSAGTFATQLDFGSQFAGQQRFLEIQVRQDTGLNCASSTGFVILSPRQNLTAAPNSLFSVTAANTSQLNAQPASFYLNASNLTAGTLPDARLSTSVDLVNTVQTIAAAKTFTAAPAFTAAGAPFTVTSTTLVTNLNADRLDGLPSTDFVQTTGTQTIAGAKTFSDPTYLNGFVGLGATSPIGLANFVVSQNTLGFGGMYLNTTGPIGSPFYGYAHAGSVTGFHYTDGADSDKWKLYLNGAPRLTVNGQGDVGIGTTSPTNHLTVSQESDTNCFVAINSGSTAAQSSGLRLSDRNTALWTINKNSNNDFTIREVAANADRLFIEQGTGNVGIGTTAPITDLEVRCHADIFGVYAVGDASRDFSEGFTGAGDGPNGAGIYSISSSTTGTGAFGYASSATGTTYGVLGKVVSPNGFGVYAMGRLGASGTKSFQIDHPLDPENKYLNHYCEEGPEPLNIYRGTVTLDEQGRATIDLPAYFSEINKDPSYTLTAVGSPMPALYVSEEVSGNHFSIAGGAPSGKVCWRVEATRNDRFVRTYGAPVEQDKAEKRGTYLQPALYNQPPEKGQFYRPSPAAKEAANATPD